MASRPGPSVASRPFPTLALLSIYHSENSRPEPTAAFVAEPDTKETQFETIKEDDAAVEARKILYFYSVHESAGLTKERKARLMGTIVGMANFARMISPVGAPTVQSVHSARQRIGWLEPEPGFYIHATIDLPRTPRAHSRSTSSATIGSTSVTRSNAPPALQDEAILAALQSAYSNYKLFHGTLEGNLAHSGRDKLMVELEAFWSEWIKGWSLNRGEIDGFERVFKGLTPCQTPPSFAKLVGEFSVQHHTLLPIILSGSSVAHLPPTFTTSRTATAPALTEADLSAIVNHLVSVLPVTSSTNGRITKTLPTSPRSIRSPSSLPAYKSPKQNTVTKSGWNSLTLGLSDYLVPSLSTISSSTMSLSNATLSQLSSIPGVNTLSNLSLADVGLGGSARASELSSLADSLKADMYRERDASTLSSQKQESAGGWGGLRNVSWSGLINGSSTTTVAKPRTVSAPVGVKALRPGLQDLVDAMKQDLNQAVSQVGQPATDVPLPASLPITPPVVLQPAIQIDTEALAAALEIEKLLPPPFVTSKVWCEGSDTQLQLAFVHRNGWTLALLSEPMSLDTALLESSYTLLDDLCKLAPTPLPPTTLESGYRYLINHAPLSSHSALPSTHSGENKWSGQSSNEENEVQRGLFTAWRLLRSNIVLESCSKTGTLHWIISSSSSAPLSTTRPSTETFLVIPASGNEGLVEAGEELRKLERLYSIAHS